MVVFFLIIVFMQNTIKNKNLSKKNIVIYILGVFLIILSWEIFSKVKNNDLFPSTLKILNALQNILLDTNTYIMVFNLIIRIIISLLVAYLISLLIVTLYHIYNPIIYLFNPLLSIMKSIPVIILTLIICSIER